MSLPDLPGLSGAGAVSLTQRQKAAVIVRILQSQGASIPLDSLPEEHQIALTRELAAMPGLGADVVAEVVREFAEAVDGLALTFPGDLGGALGVVSGSLSPAVARRLRTEAGLDYEGDPWVAIARMPAEILAERLTGEAVDVAAAILLQLPVALAAECLGHLSGPTARRISYAAGRVGRLDPALRRKIGVAIAREIRGEVEADTRRPAERIGAILNETTSSTRNDILTGLDETDSDFAGEVRAAIFAFENIPERLSERDVPKILRDVRQESLVTVMAGVEGAREKEAIRYILANISTRMADTLREEAAQLDGVKREDAESAMSEIIDTICTLEESGEISLAAGRSGRPPALGAPPDGDGAGVSAA